MNRTWMIGISFQRKRIKLEETCNTVENTLLEHKQKYGADYHRCVRVECVAEFLDKIKNEIKIKIIQSCNINEESHKVLQNRIILVRIHKLRIETKRKVF